MMGLPRIDFQNKRFGYLVAKKYMGNSNWYCECDCGGSTISTTYNLKRGNSKSCRCMTGSLISKAREGHYMSFSKVYRTWSAMKSRCSNQNNIGFDDYGGRGIAVCDEWSDSFNKFYEDMGDPPEGCSLDRIDNDKGYSLANCRWATRDQQSNNRRNTVMLTFNGKTKSLSYWVEWSGIKRATILARIKSGHTVEDALTREVLRW